MMKIKKKVSTFVKSQYMSTPVTVKKDAVGKHLEIMFRNIRCNILYPHIRDQKPNT